MPPLGFVTVGGVSACHQPVSVKGVATFVVQTGTGVARDASCGRSSAQASNIINITNDFI